MSGFLNSNQIKFIRHTHNSSQRADVPLMGYPVTKTIKTESNATHKIKNYYQDR